MRYRTTVIIDAPIKSVAPFIFDAESYPKWMEGLKSHERLSGSAGQPGSEAVFRFDMNGRSIEMKERVELNNLPDEYIVTYEASGVWNRVRHLFVGLPDGRTRYENDSEFRFKGFMAIMAIFMKGSFKKQTLKYQEDFRKFVEGRR